MTRLIRQEFDECRVQRLTETGPEIHTRCCSCAEKFWAPYRDDVDPLLRRYCVHCYRNSDVKKQAPGGRRAFQLPFNDYDHRQTKETEAESGDE